VLLPNTAHSHPHMFIDVAAKFMITDTSLAGFWVYWDFDEMNSETLIDEFDANKNRRFEPAETGKIESEAFSFALQNNLFIAFTWGTSFLKIRKAEKFSVSIATGGKIRYSFYVPCNLPAKSLISKTPTLFFEDPSMYIAFDLKKPMIQCSTADKLKCSVSFGKLEYTDAVMLTFSKAGQ
jgi:ABC-type uncharacterized transport system substrate-binding protein